MTTPARRPPPWWPPVSGRPESVAAHTPLATAAAIRALERQLFRRVPPAVVMARAGRVAARHALLMRGASRLPILVLAGPGNNGGDALVAACALHRAGAPVQVAQLGGGKDASPERKAAEQKWAQLGGAPRRSLPDGDFALVVDGLFGIGLARPLQGAAADWAARINAMPCPVLALDIPSGLCADSGRALGPVIRAAQTITFFCGKPGLHTGAGPQHSGTVRVEPLLFGGGPQLPEPGGALVERLPELAAIRRGADAHKGSQGSLALVGGSPGMQGALVLAARAAVRLGAGKVHAMSLDEHCINDPAAPEAMWRPLSAAERELDADCLAMGMGMAQDCGDLKVLERLLERPVPLVIDAGMLGLMAQHERLRAKVAGRAAPTILSPHPAEAARLAGCTTAEVQQDRISTALELASEFNAHLALKGAGTVMAGPDGSWAICASGNPGLAQAGAGDLLSGFIGAMAARLSRAGHADDGAARLALEAAVWLHGHAADILARRAGGPEGLRLDAMPETAARILNRALC